MFERVVQIKILPTLKMINIGYCQRRQCIGNEYLSKKMGFSGVFYQKKMFDREFNLEIEKLFKTN
jgi:hypothetical protein